jgi:hypothetical protein
MTILLLKELVQQTLGVSIADQAFFTTNVFNTGPSSNSNEEGMQLKNESRLVDSIGAEENELSILLVVEQSPESQNLLKNCDFKQGASHWIVPSSCRHETPPCGSDASCERIVRAHSIYSAAPGRDISARNSESCDQGAAGSSHSNSSDGFDDQLHCVATSHEWACLSQTVCLQDKQFDFTARPPPPIYCSVWFAARYDQGVMMRMKLEFVEHVAEGDGSGEDRILGSWQSPTISKPVKMKVASDDRNFCFHTQ